ncbi:hypothetical protein [Actinomadura sp. 3N407]|uniref:hypothetical protein n=1 Tax=Actinomadura sp. 3N407 TaxID=3457423 RepID=UPI003FCD411F
MVAPATFNTINKWAAGFADSFAVGLCELMGFGADCRSAAAQGHAGVSVRFREQRGDAVAAARRARIALERRLVGRFGE